jgi:tetratricopeptide (TPR) repeat protein
MYFELVTADVILADISILNANVFYELGVRHGVAPRGVLMVHGGWARRPFDVAPDRTFDYAGKLFAAKEEERDDGWQNRLDAEVERLGIILRGALDVDHQTIGSPVYKELVGLKPVDSSSIQTARAKYFGEVFVDWKSRVEVAKRNGWPGDILTLADDAPTRFHRGRLLWEAAFALISMQRFDVAKAVLEELLLLEPDNLKAQTQLGLVLGRLNKIHEAKVHMTRVAEEHAQDTEVQGILGRVYKDLWRLEWKDLGTLEERQQQAVVSSGYIASAIRSYNFATRKHRDYYNGINVVSYLKLLEHLRSTTGEEPVDCEIGNLEDLVSVVRFAANVALDSTGLSGGVDAVWAAATLGELELVTGDAEKARKIYRDAANGPDTSFFQVNSMLEQVCLFESLGFRPEAVAGVKKVLEQRRKALEKTGALTRFDPRFEKVLVFSGHMIDRPERSEERFPPGKEGEVRDRIAERLDAWGVGADDLAICGGARGGDILFAELCADRGAEVWMFLALPEGEFLEKSVRLPHSDWEQRFFALRDREDVKVSVQIEQLGSPPKGSSVFSRNNLWMINTARVEANDPKDLYAVLVWDEKPTGEGPGGTSDFATRVKQLGGRLAIINPTEL